MRALAQRSVQAAKEISRLIQQSTEQIDVGATRVEDAGKTMDEIVAAVTKVTGIISEISVASREQLAGIEQVNQAVTQIEGALHQNATVVQQSAAAAGNLSREAESLVTAVARFKLDGVRAQPTRVSATIADAAPAARAVAPQPATAAKVSPLPAPPKLAAQAQPRAQTHNTPDDGEWKEF